MNADAARRAGMLLGSIVAVIAVVGLWQARHLPFSGSEGVLVLPYRDDYLWAKHFSFNPLLALLTLGVGGLTVIGAGWRSRPARVMAMAAAGALAVAMNVDLSTNDQHLASRGGNIAMMLIVLVGLLTLELTPTAPREAMAAGTGGQSGTTPYEP